MSETPKKRGPGRPRKNETKQTVNAKKDTVTRKAVEKSSTADAKNVVSKTVKRTSNKKVEPQKTNSRKNTNSTSKQKASSTNKKETVDKSVNTKINPKAEDQRSNTKQTSPKSNQTDSQKERPGRKTTIKKAVSKPNSQRSSEQNKNNENRSTTQKKPLNRSNNKTDKSSEEKISNAKSSTQKLKQTASNKDGSDQTKPVRKTTNRTNSQRSSEQSKNNENRSTTQKKPLNRSNNKTDKSPEEKISNAKSSSPKLKQTASNKDGSDQTKPVRKTTSRTNSQRSNEQNKNNENRSTTQKKPLSRSNNKTDKSSEEKNSNNRNKPNRSNEGHKENRAVNSKNQNSSNQRSTPKNNRSIDKKDQDNHRNQKDNNSNKRHNNKENSNNNQQNKRDNNNRNQSNNRNSNQSNKSKNNTHNKQVTDKPEPKRKPEEIKIKVEPLIEPKELNKESLLSSLQRIDSYYKNTFEKFSSYLTRELFLDNHIRILVGVSGGIDSVVLLDLLANLSADKRWDIHVAHLDHGLRSDSNIDVEFVKKLAEKYGLEFHSEKQNISNYAKQKKLSVEEAGRRMRYQFFEKIGKKIRTNFVATAHNANDNAETFFLNLFRGAGLTGLSGIPKKRNLYKNVNVVRPLINWTRDQIEEYAGKRKLEWREDESNKDNKFDRNKIRNGLIPYIEKNFKRNIIPTVNRAASTINQADRFVFEKLSGGLHELIEVNNRDYTAIKIQKLQLFDEFSKYELVSMVLAKYLNIYDATFKTVQEIQSLVFSDPGSKIIINPQITAYKDRDLIYFVNNEDSEEINIKIKSSGTFDFRDQKVKLSRISKSYIEINEDPNLEYFDAADLSDELVIRNVEEGDRFNPLGMSGNIKISDFLINNKIPLFQKNKILALCSGEDIIWIMGMRISDKYKVKESTNKVLKAEIIDN